LTLQLWANAADKEAMLRARYSWRPLGALLVEKGLLTEQELEAALAEQRRTGRLVGQILVERGSLSAFALARALSEQHGVELQTEAELEAKAGAHPGWRPLGRLLVDEGYVTRAELRKALRTQRESGGRRLLGEILVAEGFLSGIALARALAEQNGFELGPDGDEPVQTILSAAAPSHVTYQVCEIAYDPRHRARDVIYESASFLEATDFAAEYVEEVDPDAIEIHRVDGAARETVWTYSDSRAAATAASKKGLAETFGFDPTLWGSA
jgi:hypothetical protein